MANTNPKIKDAPVAFRFTSETLELLRTLAAMSGMNMTAYIESLLREAQAKQPKGIVIESGNQHRG